MTAPFGEVMDWPDPDQRLVDTVPMPVIEARDAGFPDPKSTHSRSRGASVGWELPVPQDPWKFLGQGAQ